MSGWRHSNSIVVSGFRSRTGCLAASRMAKTRCRMPSSAGSARRRSRFDRRRLCSSRQLRRRAQQHVRLQRPRFKAPSQEHMELLERFYQAADSGDMDRLISLLSSDVVMHTDGGGKAAALVLPIYGPDKVARAAVHGLRRLMSLNVLQRIVEINGQPGIVSYQDGRPQSVFTVEARDGRIEA